MLGAGPKVVTSALAVLFVEGQLSNMGLQSASSTTVGAGRSGSKSVTPRSSGGSQVRQRKGGSTSAPRSRAAASSSGMWRFYTEDSPGLKIGPVPVLVMSLLFIASVFMLHIWGKYTRG